MNIYEYHWTTDCTKQASFVEKFLKHFTDLSFICMHDILTFN